MNADQQHRELVELFAEQAQLLPIDEAPLAAIAGRGQSTRRRRRARRSVAAAVIVGAVGYAGFHLLRPGSGQIAVTSPSSQKSEPSPSSVPAIAAGGTDPGPATPGTSVDLIDGATTADRTDETVYDKAMAFRDGFLLVSAAYDQASVPEVTPMRFAFTADGRSIEPIGTELLVQGLAFQAAADDGTVAVASLSGQGQPAMHIYWSDDLITWSEETFPLAGVGKIGRIPPALAGGVQVVPMVGGTLALNGDRWISRAYFMFEATGALAEKYDPTGGGTAFMNDGLHIFDDEGGDRVIAPEELGVTEDDLAVFPGTLADFYIPLLSGQRGQAEVGVYEGGAAPFNSVSFGDGFAGLNQHGDALVSQNGDDWRPLTADVGTGEVITAVSPLDDGLLVLTASDAGAKSYRLTPDGTTTFLSDVPLSVGYWLTGGDFESKPGVFAVSSRPTDLPVETVSVTADYVVTLQYPPVAVGEMVKIHYVVKDRTSGEVIVENDGEPGHDYRDGVEVAVFSDADGRPPVVIPVKDLEKTMATAPPSGDVADGDSGTGDQSGGGADDADLEFAEFATADGIAWYQSRGGAEELLQAVSGDKLLVIDVAGGYTVVDLTVAAK